MSTGIETWLGPAVVAAVVTAALTLWRDARQSVRERAESRRVENARANRQRDVAAALLAEVEALLENTGQATLEENLDEMTRRFESDRSFRPVVLTQSFNFVYRALIPDVGTLGRDVLVPVVGFYAQLDRIAHIVEDLRDLRDASIDGERYARIYRDYIGMLMMAATLGERARLSLKSIARE